MAAADRVNTTNDGYTVATNGDVQMDDDVFVPQGGITWPVSKTLDGILARVKAGELLKLNLGAGDQRYKGFIGIDITHSPACDLQHDLEQPLPLPDGCASHIYCCHTLEHLHMHTIPLVLKDWHRVLADGGILWGYVPDGIAAAQIYIEADEVDDYWAHRKATEMLLGASSYDYTRGDEQTHHCAFTVRTLSGVLNAGGFQAIQVTREQPGPWDYRLAFFAVKGIYPEHELKLPDIVLGTGAAP